MPTVSDGVQNSTLDNFRRGDKSVLEDLVGALRRREIEMRGRLTPLNIMEWLEWECSPNVKDWSLPLGLELFNTSKEVFDHSSREDIVLRMVC